MPADLRRPLPDFISAQHRHTLRDARAVAIAIASIKYYRISRLTVLTVYNIIN